MRLVYGTGYVRYHNAIHGNLSKVGGQDSTKSGPNYVTQNTTDLSGFVSGLDT